MICPACEDTDTRVHSTRSDATRVLRVRVCNACNHRWPTSELATSRVSVMESAMAAVRQMGSIAKEIDLGPAT